MSRSSAINIFIASLILLISSAAATLQAQESPNLPRPLPPAMQPVQLSGLYTLAGNTRPEANAQSDLGRAPDSFPMNHMMLQLQRSPGREKALDSFLNQQLDSRSPNFHLWLTAREFGEFFGPDPQDVESVAAWLSANGFVVNTIYPSRMLMDFSGTAGQVAAAFHTEIHRLLLDGQEHIANMSDPRIPAELAPLIAGIVSLHDFRPHAMWLPRALYTAPIGDGTIHLLAPADLAVIYDLNPAFGSGNSGQGQTIALVEDSDLYDSADWTTFRAMLGLSAYTAGSFMTINPAPSSGPTNCVDPGVTPDDMEATLDAEWASAAAPSAAIVLATCADAITPGLLISAANLINANTPPGIISYSYGECEAISGSSANYAANALAQQATAEGISMFVAAGDSGAATCDRGFPAATHGVSVSSPASSPYVVAVGGTDFGDTYLGATRQYWSPTNTSTYGSARSYIPEIPWNDSCASSLLAETAGYATGYGQQGFCASPRGLPFLDTEAGGGGPSGCASGAPSQNLVVSGGCEGFPKPAWQSGVNGIPADAVRDLPDVSLFAATGVWGHYYVTCYSDPDYGGVPCEGAPVNWSGGGGTSYASPIMAGIQALVNQKMGGAQGNPNAVYYQIAGGSAATTVFHQTTKGDIAVNCSGEINCYGTSFVGRGLSSPTTIFDGDGALSLTDDNYSPAFDVGQNLFPALGYWNFATGLGSVDAYQLILNWNAPK